MMKLLKIAAFAIPACGMFALAQPAGAADRATATANSSDSATAASNSNGEARAAREKKYCYLMDPPTGTRVPEKKCRTKAEWLAVGFDITTKK